MKAVAILCAKRDYLSNTYDLNSVWDDLILRLRLRIPRFLCVFFIFFAFCFSSIFTKNLTFFSCESIPKAAETCRGNCPKFDFTINLRIFPAQATASFSNNHKFNTKRTGYSLFQGDIALCALFLSDNIFETIAILRTHLATTIFPLREYQARAPPSV